MRNLLTLAAFAMAMAFAPLAAAAEPAAKPVAKPVPLIDWQQIEDMMQGPGDHVVGEELCARPR